MKIIGSKGMYLFVHIIMECFIPLPLLCIMVIILHGCIERWRKERSRKEGN